MIDEDGLFSLIRASIPHLPPQTTTVTAGSAPVPDQMAVQAVQTTAVPVPRVAPAAAGVARPPAPGNGGGAATAYKPPMPTGGCEPPPTLSAGSHSKCRYGHTCMYKIHTISYPWHHPHFVHTCPSPKTPRVPYALLSLQHFPSASMCRWRSPPLSHTSSHPFRCPC